jgi:hypothetical protein
LSALNGKIEFSENEKVKRKSLAIIHEKDKILGNGIGTVLRSI